MGAHVRFRFEKGFLLDEEKLRKIQDIISKRVVGEVKYSVFREDSFSFETTKIEDIIGQENLKGSRINEIQIKSKGDLFLVLDFDERGVLLDLNGETRDNVFLLSSDLKEYISNEVCTQKIASESYTGHLIIIGFVFIMGAIFYSLAISSQSSPSLSEDIVKRALESNNTNEKINILIQEQASKTESLDVSPVAIALFTIGIIIGVFSDKFSRFITWFYPANLFLFGKEFERYKQYLETKKNVFWVVGTGLLVTIIGGLIVWALTLKRA